jgi:hypothetical protein
VRGEGGVGGNNLESSFSTMTVKVASTERQTKYSWWTQNVRASGGMAYITRLSGQRHLAAEMEGCHFWTVACGLVTTGIWKREGRDGEPIFGLREI